MSVYKTDMSDSKNNQKKYDRPKSSRLHTKENHKESRGKKEFKDLSRPKNSRFFARRYPSVPSQKRYIDTCYSVLPKGKLPPLTKEQQHYYSKAFLAKMSFSEKVHKQDPKDFSANSFENFSAREMIVKSVDSFVALSKQPAANPDRCTHFIDTLDRLFDSFDRVVFDTRDVMKSLLDNHNASIDQRLKHLNERFADFDKTFTEYSSIRASK